jgi:hypothetical protein
MRFTSSFEARGFQPLAPQDDANFLIAKKALSSFEARGLQPLAPQDDAIFLITQTRHPEAART